MAPHTGPGCDTGNPATWAVLPRPWCVGGKDAIGVYEKSKKKNHNIDVYGLGAGPSAAENYTVLEKHEVCGEAPSDVVRSMI